MVWSLLMIEGLIYNLERRAIIDLLPRADVLPVLALDLEGTAQWEQRDNSLWLRSEYLPERRDQRDYPHFPPPQAPSLTRSIKKQLLKAFPYAFFAKPCFFSSSSATDREDPSGLLSFYSPITLMMTRLGR